MDSKFVGTTFLNTMDYEAKISELVASREELQDKQYELSNKLRRLEDEIDELKRQQMENTISDLSEEEEKWVRDELTVVGKILCGENVIFGGLDLLHEDPEDVDTSGYFGPKHSKKFSIDVDVSVCTEFRASLNCKVTVKTKSPKIEAIVREMFESSEDHYKPDPCRRNWPIDWDYHYSITLKNPYVHQDEKKKY